MDLYSLARRQLFKRDAEHAHDWTMTWLARIGRSPIRALFRQKVEEKPVHCMGIRFPNPVGLAAGLDKNATCIDAFAQMGFGFIEVGTVTPRSQPGNPKPRMFRLEEHNAIINRMGFNNLGVDYLLEQVEKARYQGVLGINIGKNKDTPETEAVEDYLTCFDKVYGSASYVAINISSPNTPGLRNMQHGEHLAELLSALKSRQAELQVRHGRYVPLAVKIAPDLTREEVQSQANTFNKYKVDAVIATNTTLSREAVQGHPHADEAGGLSGAPVAESSLKIIQWLRSDLNADIPIIGVGGIDSLDRAKETLAAGATLIQVYTGFIYQGPALVPSIVNNL